MSQILLDWFTKGTEGTVTGGKIGMEIETDFIKDNGWAITEKQSALIMEAAGRPARCELKLELGRQKLELSIAPQSSFELLWESAQEALAWLYEIAYEAGAKPFFGPHLYHPALESTQLLWVQEERDEVWVRLDGRKALEHLCRCSSVQFMVDINPADAIKVINKAWDARLQFRDYGENDLRQRAYIEESHAKYRPDRYGGPVGFDSMEDYVWELRKHPVVMYEGRPVRIPVGSLTNLDVDMFLRSIWWHYRLRRFGNTLAVELRPFSRRRDEDIPTLWKDVKSAIGL